jgi:hypothetical protein
MNQKNSWMYNWQYKETLTGYPDACPCLKSYNRQHCRLRGEAGTKTDNLRASASTQNTKKKLTMLYKFLQIVSPTLSKDA